MAWENQKFSKSRYIVIENQQISSQKNKIYLGAGRGAGRGDEIKDKYDPAIESHFEDVIPEKRNHAKKTKEIKKWNRGSARTGRSNPTEKKESGGE